MFFPTSYSYTWKDTPISLRQETILKVSNYAEGKHGDNQTLNITIVVDEVGNSKATNAAKTHYAAKCDKDKPSKLCKLKEFSENELTDPSISRIEKERECFWNNLSSKVDSHEVYPQ